MGAGDRAYRLWGFSSAREYGRSLAALPTIVATKASAPLLPADVIQESGVEMKRVVGPFGLICMGIGMMLGAGVFVTTGYVTAHVAGPGVILSYIAAGISALLSSFCYSEFAVDIPCAGGAYTYVAAALGEFLAWITVANLIFEYILANAAAVRGFSPYFAALTNKHEDFYILPWKSPNGTAFNLDFWAFGWCLLLTFLLILGTKESALFNNIVTVVHVVLVVFIIIAGLVKANPVHAQPFLPFGVAGIFKGASIVFFSYIGFDTVATAAEETRNPRRDLPIGILGAVLIVTVLYTLMATTLALMVPGKTLQSLAKASFAAAFNTVNMHWATYIVALGALMGIVTTTLVGMYGASRIVTGVARDHLIPPFMARVSGRFQTPWLAILAQGIPTAVLALFSAFDELADMVSISTLFAFWMVALGLVWRRSCTAGAGSVALAEGDGAGEAAPAMRRSELNRRRVMTGFILLLINAGAIVFTIGWRMEDFTNASAKILLGVGGTVALLATAVLHLMVKPMYTPPRYTAPLYPWLPALSMIFNIFLIGQLSELAFERFGIWSAACVGLYLLYSAAAAYNKEEHGKSNLPRQAADLTDAKDAGVEMTAK